MELSRQKGRYIYYTVVILLCLVMTSFWLLSNMYAKYTEHTEGTDSARVAAFVFDLSDVDASKIVDLEKIAKPGDTQKYKFIVTNEKDNRLNETKTEYTIELKISGTMPLTAQVNSDEQQMVAVDHKDADKNNPKDEISQKISLPAGQKTQHTYQLTVTWPKDYNDEKYANGNAKGHLELIVKGQQVD